MKQISSAISFLLGEFLPRLAMEMIWLLTTFAFGIYIAGQALGVEVESIPNFRLYTRFAMLIIFNAAALRIILHYGFIWLDKYMDALDEKRAEQLATIKRMINYSVSFLKKKPADPK